MEDRAKFYVVDPERNDRGRNGCARRPSIARWALVDLAVDEAFEVEPGFRRPIGFASGPNSRMSAAVTSRRRDGARHEEVVVGSWGWRTLTWPKPSRTPLIVEDAIGRDEVLDQRQSAVGGCAAQADDAVMTSPNSTPQNLNIDACSPPGDIPGDLIWRSYLTNPGARYAGVVVVVGRGRSSVPKGSMNIANSFGLLLLALFVLPVLVSGVACPMGAMGCRGTRRTPRTPVALHPTRRPRRKPWFRSMSNVVIFLLFDSVRLCS